ncbi:SusD family protein [Mucilaginibacter pineti]|uniref:SusD family protein n=1 Tax=Mucilaginibacter pineti TaxID=1391627 RepID=A0A1G7P038_9SPHI|nr:RagB/SusD family nutrient uptake outer membrane protein [Mucilaginibacter pineti]SDF79601.1 SusD family protein [Mucilaginibacter pineti]
MKKNIYQIFIGCLFIIVMVSCKKGYLDARPDKALLVPSTLADFQAILDNTDIMNKAPYLNEVSTDDIYTTDNGFAGADPVIQQSYIWAKDIFQGQSGYDWNVPYQQVFYANVVLDGLQKIDQLAVSQMQYNQIKGNALFHRAFAFYNLAQEFAKPYNVNTAGQDLGIPLRLSSDVNEKSTRGTLQATYDQIISDLIAAEPLLPLQAGYKSRPNHSAVLGLLAKVYLTMQNYTKAATYANASLQLNGKLIDYNTLNPAGARPLPMSLPNGNDEVQYYTPLLYSLFLSSSSLTAIDSTLYRSYNVNDLRKTVFFRDRGNGRYTFKGGYGGVSDVFGGIANDEIYLIRAECYARANQTADAMSDLNTLLKNRYKTGTFTSLTATNGDDALSKILTERRKELIYRNVRWTDLRRLNQDSRFAVTITRNINGTIYTLSPGSNRYVFPIPQDEINYSGIQQNQR